MSSSLYDVELDIIDVSTPYIPSSPYDLPPLYLENHPSVTTVMTVQTSQSTSQSTEIASTSNLVAPTRSTSIYVKTATKPRIDVYWVDTVSERIRVGSLVQKDDKDKIYKVKGVLKRAARQEILLCIAEDGETIGLVVSPNHLYSSWTNIITRFLLFTFCCCFHHIY